MKINSMQRLTCRHCGLESDSELDFSIREDGHGFWCEDCDGFTYFDGYENYSQYVLYMESPSSTEDVCRKSAQKFKKRLSLLRYPGAKSKMIECIYENHLKNRENNIFVEPFCGGASVGLALLDAGMIKQLVLNDKDFGIYALFEAILHYPEFLIEKINNYTPNKKSYFKCRNLIRKHYPNVTIHEAGFAFLVVNRLAYSGIVKANPLSKIDDRWNAENLINRVKKIHSMNDKIMLLNQSAEEIIEHYYWYDDAILFVDPPYIKKGKALYNCEFNIQEQYEMAYMIDHLYESHPGCADIIVTSDDYEKLPFMYSNAEIKKIGRRYSV